MVLPTATLWLTAEQLSGFALQFLLNAQPLSDLKDALLCLGLEGLSQFQTKRHVILDVHVKTKRVTLEHHGDSSILWGNVVDDVFADSNLATRYIFQVGHYAQSRGLAAAARTDGHCVPPRLRWPSRDHQLPPRFRTAWQCLLGALHPLYLPF